MDIRKLVELAKNNKLPRGLYNLEILDGSPPCSSFSISGNREKDWGKEKIFREGQSSQVLDTLFFDFIELGGILRPKVIIAENVKGLLQGNAIEYVKRIYEAFDNVGYYCSHYLLDASKMGVPQRRERVFFCAIRKDLRESIKVSNCSILNECPYLDLRFNYDEIKYGDIEDINDIEDVHVFPTLQKYLKLTKEGGNISDIHPKQQMFSYNKANRYDVLPTITAHLQGGGTYHYKVIRPLNKKENCFAGTYPLDYNFLEIHPKYLIGMSVPPLMTYGLVSRIYEQWFKYLEPPYNFFDFL